jgi:hypothetical protein
MGSMNGFLAAAVALTSVTAWPAERHLSIHSKYDTYELTLAGGGGSIGGKTADLSTFVELIPLLANPLESECPTLKPPSDATVKENGQARYIYIKQGVVTDGKGCLSVAGEGLNYFPIHRDFLVGPKSDSITLKSPLKIFRQGVKLLELKKARNTWQSADPDLILNWDFIDRFENSLHTFDVRFRALPELGQDKPKMIMQSGEQTYEFYKVTNVIWAVKKPGGHWLEASDTWGFWYDFDKDVLEDRFAPLIHSYHDSESTKDQRLSILQKFEGTWSRNLRDLYHKIVLDKSESSEAKTIAFHRLKSKPSLETAGVMAQYLKEGDDEDYKRTASQILKIQNPKGPLYQPRGPAPERAKVVEFWSEWWAKAQQENP